MKIIYNTPDLRKTGLIINIKLIVSKKYKINILNNKWSGFIEIKESIVILILFHTKPNTNIPTNLSSL